MFEKIYLTDEKKLFNPNKYNDKYIKLIIEKASPQRISSVVDKLYEVGIHDLKVIEDVDLSIGEEIEVEAEDTLTTLTNYVNAMEDVNKANIVKIFNSLYVESQEV